MNLKIFVCLLIIFSTGVCISVDGQHSKSATRVSNPFGIPADYLVEQPVIPTFWVSTYEEVSRFLQEKVHKGKVSIIGTSAGGRPIRAVFYGKPRQGKGTTTFSGSLGFGNVSAYRGPDHQKKVYLGMSAVHGGELEGIMGMINLISVIETGKDLRGKEWPEITATVAKLDRLILVPIVNPDGRVRIPVRLQPYRGTDNTVSEYLNTGGRPDGTITGWPQVKEHIPLDLKKPGFPGGYPNDAGVNIMHDNFFGKPQPETQALLDLTAHERPDLILNMHTGAVYPIMHHPFMEPALEPAFEKLFRYVQSGLTLKGLQNTKDPEIESNISQSPRGTYNLDTALNLHCGAMSVVIESPCHGYAMKNRQGEPAFHTPEMLLETQLTCHQEAMRFLADTGGRSAWTPGRKP